MVVLGWDDVTVIVEVVWVEVVEEEEVVVVGVVVVGELREILGSILAVGTGNGAGAGAGTGIVIGGNWIGVFIGYCSAGIFGASLSTATIIIGGKRIVGTSRCGERTCCIGCGNCRGVWG